MSAELIITVILIPFFVIISVAFLTYLLIVTNISGGSHMHKKGTSLLKVDVRKRKFSQYSSTKHQSLFLKLGIRNAKNVWMPFERIIKNFDSKIQVLFSNVFHKLEKGEQNLEIEFEAPLHYYRRTYANFTFRFDAIEDDSDYICRVSWNTLSKPINTKFEPNFLSKTEIISSPSKYKSFVAFNINEQNEDAKKNIVQMSSSIFKDELTYFDSSGFIIFVFFSNSRKKVKKRTDRFINKFKLRGYEKGANHLFEGSAFAISSKVTEIRIINKVIQTLDFLINVSIEKNINFVSATDHLNKKDFLKYVDAAKSFRQSIKSGNIDYINVPVKSWKSKRKRIDFAKPIIPGINENLLSSILRNQNNNKILTDAFSSFVSEKKNIKVPVLVNINDSWLIENVDKFSYKKAIYVINFKRGKLRDSLRESIEKLSKKGFVFALRVSKYNEEIATFIQKVNTKFVVIDSSFWGKDNLIQSDSLIHLMTIKKIVDQNKIQLIYEQPSLLINNENAEKIGLKFFYNLS